MTEKIRVTFDPPSEIVHTYKVGSTPVGHSNHTLHAEGARHCGDVEEVLIYCWDRPKPQSGSRPR